MGCSEILSIYKHVQSGSRTVFAVRKRILRSLITFHILKETLIPLSNQICNWVMMSCFEIVMIFRWTVLGVLVCEL